MEKESNADRQGTRNIDGDREAINESFEQQRTKRGYADKRAKLESRKATLNLKTYRSKVATSLLYVRADATIPTMIWFTAFLSRPSLPLRIAWVASRPLTRISPSLARTSLFSPVSIGLCKVRSQVALHLGFELIISPALAGALRCSTVNRPRLDISESFLDGVSVQRPWVASHDLKTKMRGRLRNICRGWRWIQA